MLFYANTKKIVWQYGFLKYNKNMRIGINASFARKANTGIGQVTLNFLKKLSEFPISNFQFPIKSQLQKIQFIIYLEEDINLKLPENWEKRVFLPFWKRDDLIRKIWWEKFLLPKKIKQDKCDVLVSLYQSATIAGHPERSEGSRKITTGNIRTGFFADAQNDITHIMIVHDIIPKLFPEYLNNWRKKLYWKLTERAIKKADKIIAISHRTEKDLIRHLGIDSHKITVNYIDVDKIYKKPVETRLIASLQKKYNLKPGYIYSGGGLEVRKNIEGVIRAYKYLLERNKNLHYVHEFPDLVISGKLMPQLAPLVTDAEKLVKELNLTQHIKLLDFVPQENLPALHKNAIMFIYPSFYEGFGLPILEAMNIGTPVITSKKSSLPEIGRDAALYCNPDDAEDIAMVMKNLLINKFLREKLSERGKERARCFSWNKFTEKILNVAENLK